LKLSTLTLDIRQDFNQIDSSFPRLEPSLIQPRYQVRIAVHIVTITASILLPGFGITASVLGSFLVNELESRVEQVSP
jgi:hypothetical protein